MRRVAPPRHGGPDRHGQAHAEIGEHLAPVAEAAGDGAVEQAEHDHEILREDLPLGREHQGPYRKPVHTSILVHEIIEICIIDCTCLICCGEIHKTILKRTCIMK